MIQENSLGVKYYHYGVFFWVQGVYVPKVGSSDPVEVRYLIPRECVLRLIDMKRDQMLFKPYKLRILFGRSWNESAYKTLRDAIAARDQSMKRHSCIGEYVIYQRSLVVGDLDVEGRSEVLFFARFNEPTRYSGDVLWEDYFTTSMAAHSALRAWESERQGMGAVYGAIDYVCPKPHLRIGGSLNGS